MENAMPLNVFNMDDDTSLARIISGERVGTLVSTPTPDEGDDDGS
jgi:uridylate kinase